MRKIFYILSLTITFLFCVESLCIAASFTKALQKGNQLYKNEKFDEALKEYNEVLVESPDSDIINYNIGTALYKKGDYQKAVESFTKALITESPGIEAKANYNIGNCKYRLGKLKENTDLAGAVGLLRESLDYYKRAIELNQKDEDAKYNHEFVERELKVLLDKLKQQQEKTGGQEEKKQEQEVSQAKGVASGREEEKQRKEEAEKKEAKEKEVEEEKRLEEERAEGHNLQEEELGQMSEQEARMLLEGYRQEEESKGEIRTRRGYYPEVLKDW